MTDLPKASVVNTGKVTLLEMILYIEQEVTRMECWAAVQAAEGEMVEPAIMRRLLVARRTVETLDLLREHSDDIAKLIKDKRERKMKLANAARVEQEEKAAAIAAKAETQKGPS